MDPITDYTRTHPLTPLAGPPLPGGTLRAIRERLGVSQDWLADTVGNSIRTISRWEQSDKPVPADLAEVIYGLEALTTAAIDHAVTNPTQTITIYRKDTDYRAAGGTITAAWHRQTAAALRALTNTTPLYGDTLAATDPPTGRWVRLDAALRRSLTILALLPGVDPAYAAAATHPQVSIEGLLQRIKLAKQNGNFARHRTELPAEDLQVIIDGDLAWAAAAKVKHEHGRWPTDVWLSDRETA